MPNAEMKRAEWFVDATRGNTSLSLAAPDGEAQANTMRDRLIGQGWEAAAHIRTTYRSDARFHELGSEK